ncbi:MAG: glycoside hydrolase family 43 protein [Planctomycetota bacterium]
MSDTTSPSGAQPLAASAASAQSPSAPPAAAQAAARLASGLVLAGLAARIAPPAAPAVSEQPVPGGHRDVRPGVFTNPIARGADPWVIRHAGRYYFCEPVRDTSIAVWTSDRLTCRGTRQIVWRAPQRAWNSHLIWAPELHRVDGRWYIYYAASAGPRDNAGHRIGVLESRGDDPLGTYEDRGVVYTGDDPTGRGANCWAIDATILELHGRRYMLWSGWPDTADHQYLYIAALANPWTTIGPRVRLCDNATYTWERVGNDPRERGLHEAPQVLQRGGRTFVVYSCSSSWQPTYKLGLLELCGDGDPLCPANWRKYPAPVFEQSADVFGVGHASFVKSPDDREDWLVYHAKLTRAPGWKRVVCLQRFGWRADGLPDFGRPAPWSVTLAAPGGDPGAYLCPAAVAHASDQAPRRGRYSRALCVD